jgi:hypothetical protein
MKTLHGYLLGKTIRSLSDSSRSRVWLISPYIGRCPAVKALLGSSWWQQGLLELRVITDILNGSYVNRGTVAWLASRGTVRTLPGVHAKIYIFDEKAVLTSANLTETAFTRRREAGILLDESESQELIQLVRIWWDENCSEVSEEDLSNWAEKGIPNEGEKEGAGLRQLWSLPEMPSDSDFSNGENRASVFSKYRSFLASYSEFANEYKSVQRLWPKIPLFMEVDAFLDFLYHVAPGAPSQQFYYRGEVRALSKAQRIAEISKWAHKFANWAMAEGNPRWYEERIAIVQSLLKPETINQLNREDARKVANCINAMNARQLNKYKFLKPENNSIDKIRRAWKNLLHGRGSEDERIKQCDSDLRFFGTSSIQELLGWYYPDKYPLKNGNSDAGLHFFGLRT